MLNPTDHHPKLWLLYSSATACFAVAVLGTLLRLVLLTHPTPVPQLELRAGDRAEMKTVGEYLEQALQFDRIAAEATDPALKASCQKQADAYQCSPVRAPKESRLLGLIVVFGHPPELSKSAELFDSESHHLSGSYEIRTKFAKS